MKSLLSKGRSECRSRRLQSSRERQRNSPGKGISLWGWGAHGTGDGEFSSQSGIALDASGKVYVADTANNRIQVFTNDGDYLAQWGSGGTGNGEFDTPQGVVIDSMSNVFVVDTLNHRVQKFGFAPTPTQTTSWGRLKAIYKK
jgi:DNA-binding beta-propeller fold protein YncE